MALSRIVKIECAVFIWREPKVPRRLEGIGRVNVDLLIVNAVEVSAGTESLPRQEIINAALCKRPLLLGSLSAWTMAGILNTKTPPGTDPLPNVVA